MRVSKLWLSWCDPNQQKHSSEIFIQRGKNVEASHTFSTELISTVYNKYPVHRHTTGLIFSVDLLNFSILKLNDKKYDL